MDDCPMTQIRWSNVVSLMANILVSSTTLWYIPIFRIKLVIGLFFTALIWTEMWFWYFSNAMSHIPIFIEYLLALFPLLGIIKSIADPHPSQPLRRPCPPWTDLSAESGGADPLRGIVAARTLVAYHMGMSLLLLHQYNNTTWIISPRSPPPPSEESRTDPSATSCGPNISPSSWTERYPS